MRISANRILLLTTLSAAGAVLMPGTRAFFADVWAAFLQEPRTAQIGFLAALISVPGASGLFAWARANRSRSQMQAMIDLQRIEIAEHRKSISALETRLGTANDKLENIDPFLVRDRIAAARLTNDFQNAVSIAENWLEVMRPELQALSIAHAICVVLLAREMGQNGAVLAEPSIALARALGPIPQNSDMLELQNTILDDKALEAWKKGVYDPSQFEPVPETTNDSAGIINWRVSSFIEHVKDGSNRFGLEREAARLLANVELRDGLLDWDVCTFWFYRASNLMSANFTNAALSEFQTLLPVHEAVKGVDHEDVFSTRADIVSCLFELSQHQQVLDVLDGIGGNNGWLRQSSTKCGIEHSITLWMRLRRAASLKKLGRIQEALKEYEPEAESENLIELHSQTLGDRHRQSLMARENYSDILVLSKRYAQALNEIDGKAGRPNVLDLASRSLSSDEHNFIGQVRITRLNALLGLNRYSEALAELDGTDRAESLKSTLDRNHQYLESQLLQLREARARCLVHLGRADEALAELGGGESMTGAIANSESLHGLEAPQTLTLRHHLLHAMAQFEEHPDFLSELESLANLAIKTENSELLSCGFIISYLEQFSNSET